MGLKTSYVKTAHVARAAARRVGLLDLLEKSERPALRHLRSLFAVYDAEDLANLDLPWWSYGAISEVERFLEDRPHARVFEFGSGASTPWLAKRSGSVVTVEHDAEFVQVVRRLTEGFENVVIHTVEARRVRDGLPDVGSSREGHEGLDFSEYVGTIDEVGGPFDLIVIDGRARIESLRRALPHVAPDGIILFDDVERERYSAAVQTPGMAAQVLHTATPCLPYRTSTALLRPEGT